MMPPQPQHPHMTNVQAFELINAGPGLAGSRLFEATLLASWAVWLIPLYLAIAWQRSRDEGRREMVVMAVAAVLALALAQVSAQLWPRPGPQALHLGRQYLHGLAGLRTEPVTLFWTLGLGALASRRHALAGFPMLALGLGVGWCRVYLGVLFPLEVLTALPLAAVAVLAAWSVRRPLGRFCEPALRAYHRFEQHVGQTLHLRHVPRD